MSTGNQGQRQGRDNGGARQGMRDQIRDAGQRLQEGVGQVGQRLQEGVSQVGQQFQEGYDAAREQMAHGYRQAEGMVARHPAQSVLVGFGVGFGLGVLLTTLLTQREEPWYERYVPEMPDSLRRVPERLRHLHLREALSRYLPDSLKG
jgi:ElaB/YqjD/DUF883 family membrane-anchored ribosome-binding protein